MAIKKTHVTLVKPALLGHFGRGVGTYFNHLKEGLEKRKEIELTISSYDQISQSADLVHFPYFDPFFSTLLPSHKPFVVTIHDLIPILFPGDFPVGIRGKLTWLLQKKRVLKASAIITDSVSSAYDIRQILKFPSQHIFPIHLAPDSAFKKLPQNEIEKIRKQFNLPKQFVLYVGDINWNKNIPNLIHAVQKADVVCVMVSKSLEGDSLNTNHPSLKHLSETFEAIINDSRFIVLGDLSNTELVGVYNAATACIVPSYYEGFGLPVVEAFSSNCPVICSRKGSLEEVAGDAAFIIDPYDIRSITDAIKLFYEDNSLRDKYAQKGLQHVKRFSWDQTISQTIRVYQGVLKRL